MSYTTQYFTYNSKFYYINKLKDSNPYMFELIAISNSGPIYSGTTTAGIDTQASIASIQYLEITKKNLNITTLDFIQPLTNLVVLIVRNQIDLTSITFQPLSTTYLASNDYNTGVIVPTTSGSLQLKHLEITGSPKLETIPINRTITNLVISKCDSFKTLPAGTGSLTTTSSFPALLNLVLSECPISTLPTNMRPNTASDFMNLIYLKDTNIIQCNYNSNVVIINPRTNASDTKLDMGYATNGIVICDDYYTLINAIPDPPSSQTFLPTTITTSNTVIGYLNTNILTAI
jgi:hypothetical protein